MILHSSFAIMSQLPALDELLQSLVQESVIFFPIRHHSPACAWHLQQLIQAEKPVAVLIEGPADATDLIPFILHEKTQTPIALYTTYIDLDRHLGNPAEVRSGSPSDPPRFAAYYPFCDYSPELVALRSGAAIGATLQFIDLSYPEQVIAAYPEHTEPQLRSLQAEHFLQRSAYLQALAQKTGCRDADDLWDHLFEAHSQQLSTQSLIENVATYCYMARLDAVPEALAAEGTIAREAAMARAVSEAMTQTQGKIVVVTGGFHTVVLPGLIAQKATAGFEPRSPLKLKPEAAQTVLMRYNFEQLDALNGYAAGMPAPEYYQRLWQQMQAAEQGKEYALLQVACEVLIEVRSLTQTQKMLTPLSVADTIAAFEQAQRLAQFRQHPGPIREDLLDAMRSCFVKGAMDGDGVLLMGAAQQVLRGDRIGDLPAEVGVPPLVQDFRRRAKQLRIKLDSSLPKSTTLDLYRKTNHRQISRFLHSLSFLGLPFATLTSGPDFVQGIKLDQIQEHWNYRWTPQTESGLIEQSLYGTTIEETTLYHLQTAVVKLSDAGEARSAIAVVKLLITACRMGLHRHTSRILTLIDQHIAADPSFVSLAAAIGQLLLLWQSREPLEAHDLQQVPQLATIAYQRLCYLIPQLANCPLEESPSVLNALSAVWELLNSDRSDRLDLELFITGLLSLLENSQSNPIVLGGATGILYNAGSLEAPLLIALAAGYLDSAVADAARGVGFLRGLLRTCREAAWSLPELLHAINDRLEQWDDDEFLKVLPDLRLAFADLIPRETDKVATIAAQLHGHSDLGSLLHRSLSERDLQLGLQMNRSVEEAIVQDYLHGWINA